MRGTHSGALKPGSALSALKVRSRAIWAAHWIPICATVLFLASDTKVVLKDRVSGAGTTLDPLILAELSVYVAVGAFLVLRRGASAPGLDRAHPIEVLMVALVALMAVSALFSEVPGYSLVRTAQTLVLVLLARAAIATGTLGWFRTLALLTLASTALLVLVGLLLPSQKGPLQVDRFNWLGTHPVVVGQFTALAVALGVTLAVGIRLFDVPIGGSRVRHWLALGVPTATCAAALAATHTRGSAIAAVCGVAVATMLLTPASLRARLALATTVGVLVGAVLGGPVLRSWLTRGEGLDSLLTLNSRTDLWSLALGDALRESPLIGFGVGASRSIFVAATGLGGGHNAVVNVFADLGLAGLALWVPLVVWPAIIVIRRAAVGSRRVDRAVWIVALVVLVVNGVTYEGLGSTPTMAFTWLLMLAAAAVVVDQQGWTEQGWPTGAGTGQSGTGDRSRRNDAVVNDIQALPRKAPAEHPTLVVSMRRHAPAIALAAVGLMIVFGALAFLGQPAATAKGRLGLTFPPEGNVLLPMTAGESSLKRYVAARAQFAESDKVIDAVATATGHTPYQVRQRLHVVPTATGNGLSFTVEGPSVDFTVQIASAAVDAYRDQTQREVDRRAKAIAKGQRAAAAPHDAAQTMVAAKAFGDGVESVVEPTASATATRGVPLRAALIGLIVGAGLASVIAWFVEDSRFRRRQRA